MPTTIHGDSNDGMTPTGGIGVPPVHYCHMFTSLGIEAETIRADDHVWEIRWFSATCTDCGKLRVQALP